MNVAGKIITVLIFVMSIAFLSLSLAVYATHTNWRDVVLDPNNGLQVQLKKQRDEQTVLENQLVKLKQEYNDERKIFRDALAGLKVESKSLQAEKEEQRKQLEDTIERERKAMTELQKTNDNIQVLQKEIQGVQDEIRTVLQERTEKFAELVNFTDQLNQRAIEFELLQSRNKQLRVDQDQASTLLGEGKRPAAPGAAAPGTAAPAKATPAADGKSTPPAQPPATPEKASPEKASPEKASPEKASPEKASPEKASPEKASPEKASPEKASPEKASPEKPSAKVN